MTDSHLPFRCKEVRQKNKQTNKTAHLMKNNGKISGFFRSNTATKEDHTSLNSKKQHPSAIKLVWHSTV